MAAELAPPAPTTLGTGGVQIARRLLPIVAALIVACGSSRDQRPGLALIPAGELLMGRAADAPDVYDCERPHEQPQHPVALDAYYIDVHEVTNAEFERVQPQHVR